MAHKKSKKYEILPDPVYQDEKVAKFINHIMRLGKKTVAQKIVYEALDIIKEKTKKEPLEIFQSAINNASPSVEVRSKRVGGATFQVPVPVLGNRKLTLASRWIVKAAKTKKGAKMQEKLANELMAAANNTGEAIKKKQDAHKMAEANRAFSHLAR